MHPVVAEMLALSHTYKTFFEAEEFKKYYGMRNDYAWPKDPSQQSLDFNFGEQDARIAAIKDRLHDLAGPEASGDGLSSILPRLRAFPIFELFRLFSRSHKSINM